MYPLSIGNNGQLLWENALPLVFIIPPLSSLSLCPSSLFKPQPQVQQVRSETLPYRWPKYSSCKNHWSIKEEERKGKKLQHSRSNIGVNSHSRTVESRKFTSFTYSIFGREKYISVPRRWKPSIAKRIEEQTSSRDRAFIEYPSAGNKPATNFMSARFASGEL